MAIVTDIFNLCFWILGIYLLLNCIYIGFFALVALFKLPKSKTEATVFLKTAILFPTYQENYVIIESVKTALSHQYKGLFEIVVIADGLLPETLQTLRGLGARVIEVFFEKSTKGKAMQYAVNQLASEGFEMVMVLDVDNVMGNDCLNACNYILTNGMQVVQTHRVAKNLDTPFAFLDACNEEVNNQIYRKGPAVVGLSPALIGSGMAFKFDYFHSLLNNIGETVGEDKQMDFMMAESRVEVAYLNDIYVYDEKIEDAKVFTKQRTRWIASQVEFMKKYALQGFVQLFKGNVGFFNKSLQTLLMPRMLLLALLFIMAVQSLVNPFGPGKIFWFGLLLSLCLMLFIAVPRRFYGNKMLYAALLQIPSAMLGMLVALFSIGKAKKSFMATPHVQKSIQKD